MHVMLSEAGRVRAQHAARAPSCKNTQTAMQEPVDTISWVELVCGEGIQTLKEARSLRDTEDSDSEPYKSKYASADLLRSLEEQLARCSDLDEANGHFVRQCIATCQLERGMVLLETDLTGEGQQAVEQGLAFSWPSNLASLSIQQQAYNALGGLWCSREEFDQSIKCLESAAQMYHGIQALLNTSSTEGDSSLLPSAPAADREIDSITTLSSQQDSTRWDNIITATADQVEQQYTTTLYYMAQVYGYAGDKLRSASYCAATLNRQLRQGQLDVSDWVQNCLQLSGYFLDCNAFALAEYCCKAVQTMLLDWYKQQQKPAHDAQASFSHQQQHQQQPNEEQPRTTPADGQQQVTTQRCGESGLTELEQGRGTAMQSPQDDCARDQAKQPQLHVSIKGELAEQQSRTEHDSSSNPLTTLQPVLQSLEEDIAANVQLAFAKLHLYRLVASHQRYIEGKDIEYGLSSPADVPEALCFDSIQGLPQLPSLQWGDTALATDYDAALPLFKQALPWFRGALKYYQLEGWVTEHCHILFEMSNLYRCLAGFESDAHRRCVMHRNRAKLLQGLEGQLSHAHYPGLSRSISLELGNIYREIADIKASAGREPDKVVAASKTAAQHYQLFLDSFKGPDDKMPDKVESEMEQHFLGATFCMARVLQTSAGVGKQASQEETLEQAIHWLNILAKYVERNQVASHQQEAQLAGEMAHLLREKLALQQQVQQRLTVDSC